MTEETFHLTDQTTAVAAAETLFRHVRDVLEPLLPAGVAIEHVGATAVPGCLTKGDLDIAIRVEQPDFEVCLAVLSSRYAVNSGSVRTASFAAFTEPDARPPLGIQLAVVCSPLDVFTRFRDRLLSDPDLTARYNALKQRHDGGDMTAYQQAKGDFIAAVLGPGRPA